MILCDGATLLWVSGRVNNGRENGPKVVSREILSIGKIYTNGVNLLHLIQI